MKEVKEWDGNPREMYVYDHDENQAVKATVHYIAPSNNDYPVFATIVKNNYKHSTLFKHCAEIEAEKQRLMTHKELARWLREKPNREYKCGDYENVNVHSVFVYGLLMEDEPVDKKIYVREGDEPWHVPLVVE